MGSNIGPSIGPHYAEGGEPIFKHNSNIMYRIITQFEYRIQTQFECAYIQTNKHNLLLHYCKKRVIALTQHAYIKPKGFSGKNTKYTVAILH